ncbi:hypothetical protein I4F81_009805 [Pyropia yezoensis]|uniref:Uncharacterized protein n=1 Tax=Pyropia yezoensis TaxID=2788 RepID=A0ACC3CBT1_PYRYE|nr:hypothetical protein I4F81_009805 [Neopyropia yezoensis]
MAPMAFWTAVAVGVGAVAVAGAGSGGTLPVGAYVVADKMAAAASAVSAAAARVSLPWGLRPPPPSPPPSPPLKPAAAPDAAYVAALTAPLVAPRGVEPPLLPAVSVVVVVRAAGGDGQAAAPTTSTITTYHAGVGSPTDETRYELGSITKVFASLLLARAVAAGRVRLDTPVADLLPAAALPLPPPHWPRVTLQQLATHTAGLPREPPGGEAAAAAASAAPPPGDTPPPVAQPHAIPMAAWIAGLRGVSFRTPPGTRWAYSNFGAGLLGHVVARAVGAPSFAAAVREWVFVPAGMAAAAVADGGGAGDGFGAPEAGGGGEVATPHDGGGQEAVLSVARPGGGRAEQLWVAVLGARRRLFPVDATARAFDVRPGGLRVRFVGLPPVTGADTRGGGGAGGRAKPALWVSGGGLPFSLRCRRVEAAEEVGWWGRLEGAVGGLVWRWAGQ